VKYPIPLLAPVTIATLFSNILRNANMIKECTY